MEHQKHSGLGIASFISSIVSGILMFLVILIVAFIEISTPGGIIDNSAGEQMVGISIIAIFWATLIALGLGIAGLIQKERKKIFAILGTVFAAVTIVIPILLFIIGFAER